MDTANLKKFDLSFPGHWIAGPDRDWAFETALILSLVESAFIRAVASYAMFEPVTASNVQLFDLGQSKYERCLNGIYATSFIVSLDAISKLLEALKKYLRPPDTVITFISEYESAFGHLKHIRDSMAHIEDRGRGVDKYQRRIPTYFLILGAFIEGRFGFTASDGKYYEIELSESTLFSAQQIIQKIINAYGWE
jgi:hypothetical protein